MKAREVKRAKMVAKYAEKRAALKKIINKIVVIKAPKKILDNLMRVFGKKPKMKAKSNVPTKSGTNSFKMPKPSTNAWRFKKDGIALETLSKTGNDVAAKTKSGAMIITLK